MNNSDTISKLNNVRELLDKIEVSITEFTELLEESVKIESSEQLYKDIEKITKETSRLKTEIVEETIPRLSNKEY